MGSVLALGIFSVGYLLIGLELSLQGIREGGLSPPSPDSM